MKISDFSNIITESIRQSMLLREGSRDNMLAAYFPLFEKRGIRVSVSQLKQALLAKFVNEAGINALSLGSNYYLAGVARYYFEGLLTQGNDLGILNVSMENPDGTPDVFNRDVCIRLNALIEILRNSYIDSVGTEWEQPEDFGALPLDKLLKKYGKKIDISLGIVDPKKKKKENVGTAEIDHTAGKNYTFEVLYSYDDAKKYKEATAPGSWCITYGKQHYDGYIRRLRIHYVIYRLNGYENVPRQKGKNFSYSKPQDEYGNSLIAVLQSNTSPEPIYITSRWNHGSSVDGTSGTEADHAYTKEEFLKVIGDDGSSLQRAFDEWSVNKKKRNTASSMETRQANLEVLRFFKYAQISISNGSNPEDFFKLIKPVTGNEGPKPLKGAVVIGAMIGDNSYYALMDRKNIIFESIRSSNNLYYPPEPYYHNNILVWKKVDANDKTSYLLYDITRHRPIQIDNVTLFKYGNRNIATNFRNAARYVTVAVSGNQVALIDTNTCKPIRTPRGACWFETVKNFSHIDNRYQLGNEVTLNDINDGGLVEMVYDSASEETYMFNTVNGQFYDDSEILDEGWKRKNFVGGRVRYCRPNGLKTVKFHDNPERSVDEYESIYIDPTTKVPLNIEGVTKFEKADYHLGVWGYEEFHSGVVRFYNTQTKRHISFNGKEIIGEGNNMWGHLGFNVMGYGDNGPLELHTNYQREGDVAYLYIPEIDDFYHDDISGYQFRIYGNFQVYAPDGSKYPLPVNRHLMIKQMKDKYGDAQSNIEPEDDGVVPMFEGKKTIHINESDVRRLVRECAYRTLDRIQKSKHKK